MSAKIFGDARYAMVDEESATGLHMANLTYNYNIEQAEARNHLGNKVSLAFYDDTTEISADGVVASKTTGFVADLASVITLANESADSLSLNDQNLITSANANAGTIITGMSLTRSNTDYETGSMELLFCPLIATNSPTTLTD